MSVWVQKRDRVRSVCVGSMFIREREKRMCVCVCRMQIKIWLCKMCVCLHQGTCVLVCMQKRHKERERDISVSV